jgi:hypothetical protein
MKITDEAFENEINVEDIALSYEKIDELVRSNDMLGLNRLVEKIIECNVSYELQSAILRYTFCLKDKIPKWNEVFQHLEKEMQDRNIDSESILFGLQDNDIL